MLHERERSNENRSLYLLYCGLYLAEIFYNGVPLICDIDGVICKADSLDRPELISSQLIESLLLLESHGVAVGVATARGELIINYLRDEHSLHLNGPLILESGHLLIEGSEKKHLAGSHHKSFIEYVRKTLKTTAHFRNDWLAVQDDYKHSGATAFCPGNIQWQGECRASFWFYAHGEKENDQKLLAELFEPTVRYVAQSYGLSYEMDVSLTVNRMKINNNTEGEQLGIISLKGKRNGVTIQKGTAAEQLKTPWVFVADGFEDMALADLTRSRNGAVVGIKGNLDDSDEPIQFLINADCILDNPDELAIVLYHAHKYLLAMQ